MRARGGGGMRGAPLGDHLCPGGRRLWHPAGQVVAQLAGDRACEIGLGQAAVRPFGADHDG
jgi:hypothetical protein